MHLTRPADALREMRSLVNNSGVVVCEEADFSNAFCEPSSFAYKRLSMCCRIASFLAHPSKIALQCYQVPIH